MSDAILMVAPWAVVLLAAIVVVVTPRMIGHGLAVLALAYVIVFSLFAPDGSVSATFIGFEVVPVLIDPFTRMLGAVFGFLGAMAVIYAYSTDAPRIQSGFALGYVGSTLAVCFVGDWLLLVFFYELMALASTLLIWHYGGRAVRRGFRYALWHGIGGSLVLLAVMWHVAETGSLVFEPEGLASGIALTVGIVGVGINLGFVGLHTWLPDAYPAPHVAASVFLSVFTTKSAVYVLYRALPDDGAGIVIAYMGGIMAVYGVVFALLQHDMRALLSYHIMAQVGYMTAGVGLGTALAVSGAMAHLFNNVLYKSLLFMAVGVIIYRTGKEDLYELGGLWRMMPITATTFAIGALSISAFPGFNGFISKSMVMDGALYEGHEALWLLLLIGGLGTFLSFIKLGYYAFLNGESTITVRDAKPGQSIAMVVISVLCVVMGLFPGLLHSIIPLTPADVTVYSSSNLAKGFGLAFAGVVGFALVRKTLSGLGHIPDIERLTHPGGFYLGRISVLVVTESFAAIDRVIRSLVDSMYRFGSDPVSGIERFVRQSPPFVSIDSLAPSRHGDTTYHLRAGIGRSILLLVVTTILIFMLVARPV